MLDLTILFLLLLIVFAYVGYPLISFFIGLVAPQSVVKDDNYLPSVSLMIAAYNEEVSIAQKIENSLKLDYPKELLRIKVVSDGSTDQTDQIVAAYAPFGVELLRVEGRVGKTQARNVAVLQDRSEIIVFSDATAIYEENSIRKLVRNFADPSVGMVSGHLEYFDQVGSTTGLSTKLYWRYETLIKKSQSRLFTLTGAIGCINAFRRDLYHVLPANIIEDFTEPLAFVARGYRVVYEREAVAYERTTQRSDQEYKMRIRVIRGGMSGAIYAFSYLKLWRQVGATLQLISHKVLRWLVPVFLMLILLLSILSAFEGSVVGQLLVGSQVLFYGVSVLSLLELTPKKCAKIFAIPTYFLVVNAASLKALYLCLTTDLEATWETNVY